MRARRRTGRALGGSPGHFFNKLSRWEPENCFPWFRLRELLIRNQVVDTANFRARLPRRAHWPVRGGVANVVGGSHPSAVQIVAVPAT